VVLGDCRERLRDIPDESIDAAVTDPPYELGFMGKGWDATGIANDVEMWREVLRVLKPGGHVVASSHPKTYHRMTCAIEDAGFEIRDCLQWLYGTGFPKSLNVGEGRGTALKPGYEPIVLARKPLAGTVAANVQLHGTGALNIDACRIETTDDLNGGAYSEQSAKGRSGSLEGGVLGATGRTFVPPSGRWPANVLLDEEAARSVGGASRFFYTAKASRKERDGGGVRNTHPTVKPIALMRWLCRLVVPPCGVVLDPFCGSGSTGVACAAEGLGFIGIEKEAEYVDIARRRLASMEFAA
jgi:site-specific DNA-methyltransferase (adenine-specific)